VEYPLGHRRRRAEGIPLLVRKAAAALEGHYGAAGAARILELFEDRERLAALPVHAFMSRWVPGGA
jgi:2-methylcitrate dehydratase